MSLEYMGFLIPEQGSMAEAVYFFNQGGPCWCGGFHCDLPDPEVGRSRCDPCILCNNFPIQHSETDAATALRKELAFARFAEEHGFTVIRKIHSPGPFNNHQDARTIKMKE